MAEPGLRIDKWLWHARFFKTRSLATKLVAAGSVRVNATPVKKAAALVRPGDTLTFPKDRHIRVVRIVALGARRGPAPEAQALYEDLSPPVPKTDAAPPKHPDEHHTGRPTKKLRRTMQHLKGREP